MVRRRMTESELEWIECDDCHEPFIITAVLNPRRDLYSVLPLSRAPQDVPGNFSLTEHKEEVYDAEGNSYGLRPLAVYGQGDYRPHNPSHFLEEVHADERRHSSSSLRLEMDEA